MCTLVRDGVLKSFGKRLTTDWSSAAATAVSVTPATDVRLVANETRPTDASHRWSGHTSVRLADALSRLR